jgi:hypothetical protein
MQPCRTTFYCVYKKFRSRHDKNEKISSLWSRLDQVQSELRLATSNVCTGKELEGVISRISYFSCACSIQGLSNERIQTIARSRGERGLLSTSVETPLEEESEFLSARDRA